MIFSKNHFCFCAFVFENAPFSLGIGGRKICSELHRKIPGVIFVRVYCWGILTCATISESLADCACLIMMMTLMPHALVDHHHQNFCNTVLENASRVSSRRPSECTAVAAIRLRMRMRILTRPENSLANFCLPNLQRKAAN